LLIIILLNLGTETETVVQLTPKKPTIDKQEWKMEEDRVGYKKPISKIVKKESKPKKIFQLK
jgi:hypothetical protein